MAWQQAEAAFVAQCPDDIHDLITERVVSIFALNCLQARHWVRVDYDAVLYRSHVPIIVQCQCGVCYLSSKDSTVVWEPFGQLAASRRHHALVNLRYVSVNFSMWSLSIAILSELGLSLFCDHTFAHMLFGSYWCVRGKGCYLQGARPFLIQSLQRSWLPLLCDKWVVPGVGSFLLGRYRYLVVGSNSCSEWCAGLSVQVRDFR